MQVRSAIAAAERFLLARQSADGLWRDYPALEPGLGEAWITGVVGWSLTLSPTGTGPEPLAAAAESLHALAKSDGWGYNRHTACDADSTAWVWRFLAQIDDYRARSAAADLRRYLGADGTGHTFRGAQFGSWSGSHADVTPVLGLALLAVHDERELAVRVRDAVLSQRSADGLWRSFWWTTDAYALARNLEFLEASGRIPDATLRCAARWLESAPVDSSAFGVAQELAAAVLVDEASAIRRCAALLAMQQGDGGWTSSRTLLVPRQQAAGPDTGAPAFADDERVMSTAMAMAALKGF